MTPQILKVAKSLAGLGSDLGLAVAVAKELQKLNTPIAAPPTSIVRRKPKSLRKIFEKAAPSQKSTPVEKKKGPGRPKGSQNKSAEPPAPAMPRVRPPSPQAQAELSFDDEND